MFAFFLALASPDIRLAPESKSSMANYQRIKGESLVCNDFAEGLQLCYRVADGQNLVLLNQTRLKKIGVKPDALKAIAKSGARTNVNSGRYYFTKLEGMKGGYWVSSRKDGWDAGALLHPNRLFALLGGKRPLVAVPESGMFIFWESGNPLLNKVMAVGVSEIHQKSKRPVSPFIYQYKGDTWTVWGEAKPLR